VIGNKWLTYLELLHNGQGESESFAELGLKRYCACLHVCMSACMCVCVHLFEDARVFGSVSVQASTHADTCPNL
jgi:DNA-directed RNA polymerase subunit N (RpoN/RPB10)